MARGFFAAPQTHMAQGDISCYAIFGYFNEYGGAQLNILILGNESHFQDYLPDLPVTKQANILYRSRNTGDGDIIAAYPDTEVLVVDAMRAVPRALIHGLPKLKLIHCEGVGYDRIDLAAARERGVFVCNTQGSNADAVAEQVIMLLLMLLRQAVYHHDAVWQGRFSSAELAVLKQPHRELCDCTVGLVGFGDIAKSVARRLAPFGCRVVYHTPRRKAETVEREYGVTWLPLEDLAAVCDFVSLHCPATDDTFHLVDDGFLARMKPTACLVNTARGGVVDTAALCRALVEGRLGGAALDTFENEPSLAGNPILDLPEPVRERVILQPHIGGLTTRFFRLGHQYLWQNVARVTAGERPERVVNGL